MKVIAKSDLGYKEYPYINWNKDKEYPCKLSEDGNILNIIDEEGVIFHFSGKAKANLNQVFEIMS